MTRNGDVFPSFESLMQNECHTQRYNVTSDVEHIKVSKVVRPDDRYKLRSELALANPF